LRCYGVVVPRRGFGDDGLEDFWLLFFLL